MTTPRSTGAARLACLLRLLAGGRPLAGAWEEAGYGSREASAEALERHARRLSPPADGTAPPEEHWDGKPVGTLVVHADGAARGNPGPAAAAAVAFDAAGKRLASVSAAIGTATNNVAEYQACLLALKLAARLGARRITVRMDSELVVRQLRGEYRIRNDALRGLADEALAEARGFDDVAWEHVPRSGNTDADRLANETLDAERDCH
ncbi:MAG: ribonuclease HI family protein [Candidatus Krumholzibacteria bacterium]|nr:ribonuclease HI family protein [Candidatus Krumholzibacteria bacterium]